MYVSVSVCTADYKAIKTDVLLLAGTRNQSIEVKFLIEYE